MQECRSERAEGRTAGFVCAARAPSGLWAALEATGGHVHVLGDVSARRATLRARALAASQSAGFRPARDGSAYDPATITSSFLTDFTPGTPATTFAAFSRSARLFAVP